MCPVQVAGVESSGVGSPTSDMTVSPLGAGGNVVIDYGAANPLAWPVAADINDPSGKKLFLGGFAPHGKEQILRLYGLYNPKDILGLARIRGSIGRL
jgi:hypothetical protein